MSEMLRFSWVGQISTSPQLLPLSGLAGPTVIIHDGPHRLLSTSPAPVEPFDLTYRSTEPFVPVLDPLVPSPKIIDPLVFAPRSIENSGEQF
jgi:hypothetical protein